MAHRTVTLDSYRCDGCGKERYAAEDGEAPYGLHGNVFEINARGGSGAADFYACRPACIRKAVTAATERAWDQ